MKSKNIIQYPIELLVVYVYEYPRFTFSFFCNLSLMKYAYSRNKKLHRNYHFSILNRNFFDEKLSC
jgi:hypothetical protein